MRDCLAIGVRNQLSMLQEPLHAVRTAAKATLNVLTALEGIDCPILYVSYEKAMHDPRGFCAELIDVCGIEPTADQIEAALADIMNGPDAYLQASLVDYDGAFQIDEGGGCRAGL